MVKVVWNDAPIKARARLAGANAMKETKAYAAVRCAWRHVRNSIIVETTGEKGIVAATSPDAMFLERGTGRHAEAPRIRQAMKFPDGGFAAGTVEHPGTHAHPFLEPAAEAFPEIAYRSLRVAL